MFKKLLTGVCFFVSLNCLHAQGWEKAFGGPNVDIGNSVIVTADGGMILCGNTTSFAPNFWEDVYVVRTDVDGDTLWTKTYGAEELREYAHDIIETSDGAFLIVGFIRDPTGNTAEEAFLLKIDDNGNTIWQKSFGGAALDLCYSVIETADGGFAAIGETESFGSGGKDIFLAKTNESGDTLWTKTYGGVNNDYAFSIVETTDNGFAIAAIITSGSNSDVRESCLIKTDANGNLEWTNCYGQTQEVAGASVMLADETGFILAAYIDYSVYLIKIDEAGSQDWAREITDLKIQFGRSLTYTTDGGIAISGYVQIGEETQIHNAKLVKTTPDGDVVWSKEYGGLSDDRAFSVCKTDDGGVTMAGFARSIGNGLQDMHLIRTDSLGNVYTNFVEGNVYYDLDENCALSGSDYGLNDWLIEVSGEKTFYGFADEAGNYLIPVEAGDYSLNLILHNQYWESCDSNIPVSFSGTYDTLTTDLAAKSIIDCPLLRVDISTPFLRRCFDNDYTVVYCNTGTQLAEDATIDVTLDEYLIVNNTSIPYILPQTDNTYTFELGDVDVGECNHFKIYTTVECDSTILGQTHCADVHIYPDTICLEPDPLWSGASIELSASCQGDSVSFFIKNVGTATSDPSLEYIVIIDDVILLEEPEQIDTLPPGGTKVVKIPVEGETLRLEADQEPGHPGDDQPSVTVEGCGLVSSSEWSLGYYTQFSENDGNPFVSFDCQENIGSWDPNDKRGFPKGYREEHLITASTDLEYHIRFQNTGTDTAFRVVIRDTISEFLNIHTFTAGASSHPYDVETYGNGIVKFIFDNIYLPDSTTNEVGSHGFVKFRIAQKPGNVVGTEIYNSAAIYFDYNEPVITNKSMHKIGEDFVEVVSSSIEIFVPEVKVNVYPNPFEHATTFEILHSDNQIFTNNIFRLYDMNGRMVRQENFSGNKFQLYRNGLQPGIYFYNIYSNKELIFGGKLIAH